MFIRTKSEKVVLDVHANATDEPINLITIGHEPVEVDDAIGRSLIAAHDVLEQCEGVAPEPEQEESLLDKAASALRGLFK
jgi:hypothetical protein